MKIIVVFGICLAAVFSVGIIQAQETSTLFKKSPKIGGYVSPNLQFGPVASEGAYLANIKGAVTFNNQFAVGATYSTTFNEFTPDMQAESGTYLDLQLGGLLLEYTLNPNRMVHFTFPLTLGAGEIELDYRDDSPDYNDGNDNFGEDNFLFFEPGALLEINLLNNLRLNGGLTYRLIPGGVDYRGLNANDISGFTGSIGLKIGLFR
jgi:hypothetical protein